ncbi:hypothetical protein EVG20_g6758 [Dentipellis fragilis]|uniref:Uncharacterized protein n=1 Tax=Dentipellis fragilis TaxID=205917 RepID=A0A4Y9YIC1_9AGAM|nr:hypothetical protein EVG20_g6758 [Dentipellis fragilis]
MVECMRFAAGDPDVVLAVEAHKAREGGGHVLCRGNALFDSLGVSCSTLHEGLTPLRIHALNALFKNSNAQTQHTMLSLILTLALAFVSFLCSAFVILRIIIPVLPPHPLSRRVAPSEFGLPNYRSVSAADKSHVWLAFCDVLALAIFVWQAVSEYLGNASGYQIASDPGAATRLWFALTVRQTCLLIVSGLTLLHVRMGRSVSFGAKHWILWAPMLVVVVTSTALAGVLAGAGLSSFFIGYVAYSTVVAVLSTVFFGCLITSLVIIKRNLTAINEAVEPWPPVKEIEEKPRPSFATEDIDALPSRGRSHPSIPAKSSFWFNPATPYTGVGGSSETVPPVPPIPSPYRTQPLTEDPDPFRRSESPHAAKMRMGSQSSWLTSSSGTRQTASAWSFPTERVDTPFAPALASTQDLNSALLQSRPVTPAMASAQVLGGYGYAPSRESLEQGIGALAAVPASDIDVSGYRIVGWLASIWIPFALSLPFFFSVSASSPQTNQIMSILLTLSVTLSSPILALNILLRSPMPIITGLFDVHSEPPSMVARSPSPQSTLPAVSGEYKRSASVTVVEGRRSTDVWLTKGDAVDGKSRVGRALGMLAPQPKLSVLPPEDDTTEPLTPPLPIQDAEAQTVPPTPQSQISAELGHTRTRKESHGSSHFGSADESLAFNTRIMVAQRHYSAVATAMVLPPSPTRRVENGNDAQAGQVARRMSNHLRTHSESSFSGPRSPGARLQHRKSYSSGFDFGAVAGTGAMEIDALSAGLLPLLVPGLRVGADTQVTEDWAFTAGTLSKSKGRKHMSLVQEQEEGPEPEFGGFSSSLEFSSPQMHSTPVNRKGGAKQRSAEHKRHHFSLPSLSLGKDGVVGMATWRNEVNHGPKGREGLAASAVETRRNTYNGQLVPAAQEPSKHEKLLSATTAGASLSRSPSGRTLGPRPSSMKLADLPTEVNTARSSLATLIAALEQPMGRPLPSATSEVTLFDLADGSGPLAESTPPDYRRYSGASVRSNRSNRRSSIVYKKSEDTAPPTTIRNINVSPIYEHDTHAPTDENTAPSTKPNTPPGRFAQWSTRAVRPLVPKSSKKSSLSPKTDSGSPNNVGFPSGGLRPLSLLQDRNGASASIQPLSLGKKTKQKQPAAEDSENAAPSPGKMEKTRKRLRSFKLARSDTTKERAVLREREVLPDVVVRPPSQVQPSTAHTGYPFGFR